MIEEKEGIDEKAGYRRELTRPNHPPLTVLNLFGSFGQRS